MPTPRVAAIHDLSGFGRCSLTVAIPVLSAMGVQCCPLPTAFLSTHTGGFEGYTFLDLTGEMAKAAAHWKALGLHFDAVYSGFLGSERQIDLVRRFLRDFRREGMIAVVDPVMGDFGRVYETYTPAMCRRMAELTADADVITPNLTEAALLLGVPFESLPRDAAGLRALTEKLGCPGKRSVTLTGVSLEEGKTGAMCYDAKSGRCLPIQTERVDREFLGAGDVFASVLTGALVRGDGLFAAAAQAIDFIRLCAVRTAAEDIPLREGVDFEPLLGRLVPREA